MPLPAITFGVSTGRGEVPGVHLASHTAVVRGIEGFSRGTAVEQLLKCGGKLEGRGSREASDSGH